MISGSILIKGVEKLLDNVLKLFNIGIDVNYYLTYTVARKS